MKIVSFALCPFVQRVTALLEALGCAYTVEFIRLDAKPSWFLEASPHGQVPIAILEDGAVVFESDAIVEYIQEVHGPLHPGISAVERAHHRAWSVLATKNYLVQCATQRSPTPEIFHERTAKLNKAFAKIEGRITGPYFDGDQLSQVDISWLVLLHRAALVERRTGYDFVGAHAKTKAWQDHLMNTGLAERSVSEDFEDAFARFYLAQDTVLGGMISSSQ